MAEEGVPAADSENSDSGGNSSGYKSSESNVSSSSSVASDSVSRQGWLHPALFGEKVMLESAPFLLFVSVFSWLFVMIGFCSVSEWEGLVIWSQLVHV